jgi:hypothetical protein
MALCRVFLFRLFVGVLLLREERETNIPIEKQNIIFML